MTTDITELALIAKIKKQTENFDTVVLKEWEALALVEALEKAQQKTTESENRVRKQNRHICELFDDNTALRQRIAELESRAVKLIDCDFGAVQHMSGGSTDYCNGFVDGTQNAIRSITAAGIKVEAE
ncbi:hypothetical protein SM74_00710 [Klebsiella variicola]|nr:hypothetical protein [Klebsiella variicola]KMH62562.1 hypothetical protein SM74_00710 [Klebsiella variicola]